MLVTTDNFLPLVPVLREFIDSGGKEPEGVTDRYPAEETKQHIPEESEGLWCT